MWKILLFTGLFYVAIIATNLGYNIDYGRSEMLFYEKSLVKNPYFFFGRYNRTNFCLNVSFLLLEDLDGNHIKSTTSVHQLRNGHYSPVGIELTYNVCDHYKKNIFGIKTQLAQYGNLTACDIKKGFYYMYNFMPDESFFPKAVPFGDYMIQMDVRRDSGEALLKFSCNLNCTFDYSHKVDSVTFTGDDKTSVFCSLTRLSQLLQFLTINGNDKVAECDEIRSIISFL